MIKPIETNYNGYRMRSRLEARWAVFFDVLLLPWEYEKEGFNLGDGVCYLPDFYLPTVGLRSDTANLGLWVEVKPPHPHIIGELYRKPDYENVIEKFVKESKQTLVLLEGPPEIDKESNYQYAYHPEHGFWWDNYMQFMKCFNPDCGYVKLEFMECNYEYCPKCNTQASADHPLVVQAIYAAKGARFEHGCKGRPDIRCQA